MVFLDILTAFFYLDPVGFDEPDDLLDLREIVFQGGGGRCRRGGVSVPPNLTMLLIR
jgi:hypothetical protein